MEELMIRSDTLPPQGDSGTSLRPDSGQHLVGGRPLLAATLSVELSRNHLEQSDAENPVNRRSAGLTFSTRNISMVLQPTTTWIIPTAHGLSYISYKESPPSVGQALSLRPYYHCAVAGIMIRR